MDSMVGNDLLKRPPDTEETIKKLYDLDKPGRIEDALKILTEWLQKQDHIIKKDFSKTFLEMTLITCKGSVEKAKRQIDYLCTMRTLVPKFFSKTNVKMELKNITDIVSMIPVPTLTDDYCRIVIFKIKPKQLTPEILMEYYQYSVIFTEYIKANDYFEGLIIIDDYTQVNILELVSNMNTAELQQYFSIMLKGYGARLKDIHILTESSAVDLFIKIIKQFVSEKIGNRINVQKTLEDLHKVVPKEILPIEYGGNERSVHKLQEEWIEALSSEKHVEYMKMMNSAGTDESKRHEGIFNEEYLGMPGSFRDLRVD